ncbi:PLP-dependent transferase [Natrinema soli]|uniref:PLP-dependent transferase n=1 Tax=Natrinema soli TaxID=1930624 RepID=A0ABD5SJJ9_9EURY
MVLFKPSLPYSEPGVKTVHYPGLESHPQHQLATEQMRGATVSSLSKSMVTWKRHRQLSRNSTYSLPQWLGGMASLVDHP